MRIPFTGVGTALVTPFRKDGSVDESAVKRLARRQIDAGIHFLSPCGTTGEAPTLSHREKLRIVELVVEEANGRVPVLAGAGGYDTREAIELARITTSRRRKACTSTSRRSPTTPVFRSCCTTSRGGRASTWT
jgi:dihydrodipicolinate synthase/N-acetylneuraminate lyase